MRKERLRIVALKDLLEAGASSSDEKIGLSEERVRAIIPQLR